MKLETMRLLVAKGLSAEDILEVAETMAVPAGRSAAAERQARYRARQKEEQDGVTRDVTRDGDSVMDPSLSPSPNEINSNPHPHTHPDRDTPRARKADPFPKPDWAEAQHWADLKANRKAKRLPNTATAHAKLLRDIDALTDDAWPPGRLLEAIVARGWAAAYDPRESPKNDRKSPRHDEPQNAYVRAALAGQSRREAERTGAEFG